MIPEEKIDKLQQDCDEWVKHFDNKIRKQQEIIEGFSHIISQHHDIMYDLCEELDKAKTFISKHHPWIKVLSEDYNDKKKKMHV